MSTQAQARRQAQTQAQARRQARQQAQAQTQARQAQAIKKEVEIIQGIVGRYICGYFTIYPETLDIILYKDESTIPHTEPPFLKPALKCITLTSSIRLSPLIRPLPIGTRVTCLNLQRISQIYNDLPQHYIEELSKSAESLSQRQIQKQQQLQRIDSLCKEVILLLSEKKHLSGSHRPGYQEITVNLPSGGADDFKTFLEREGIKFGLTLRDTFFRIRDLQKLRQTLLRLKDSST